MESRNEGWKRKHWTGHFSLPVMDYSIFFSFHPLAFYRHLFLQFCILLIFYSTKLLASMSSTCNGLLEVLLFCLRCGSCTAVVTSTQSDISSPPSPSSCHPYAERTNAVYQHQSWTYSEICQNIWNRPSIPGPGAWWYRSQFSFLHRSRGRTLRSTCTGSILYYVVVTVFGVLLIFVLLQFLWEQ